MTDKTHTEIARKKALAAEYAEKLRLQGENLLKSLTRAQYDFLTYRASADPSDPPNTTIYDALVRAMRKSETVPSTYISQELSWLFQGALDKGQREIILYYADRLQEYPYSLSHYRRSFRAANNAAYTQKLVAMIRAFGRTCIVDAPLYRILNRELPEDVQAYLDEYKWIGCGYVSWQVAYALDSNDPQAEAAIRRVLTEDTASHMLTTELIRGVLCSHRNDFHALVAKLLVAARLEEGLRQVICENADYGTRAAFLTILQAIEENNLIRYSSVKRAVGTWLGILPSEIQELERVSAKSIRLISDCLENENEQAACLASEDAMSIYIALWSYAFDDVNIAIDKIAGIVENGSHHQLLVAGYFTANMDLPYASNKIAKRVLRLQHDKDDILAVWLPCFLPNRLLELRNSVNNRPSLQYDPWFDGKDEICEYNEIFQSIYSSFSGNRKTFSPCVFPWLEVKIEKSDLAEILCILALLSKENDKLDRACSLIKHCHSHQRHLYFSALLRQPQTAPQRKALLEGLTDKESYTRKAAFDIISTSALTDDEYRSIEENLRFKSADIRNYSTTILLRQNDHALFLCISRLLENENDNIRFAALDMLMQLKQDPTRNNILYSLRTKLVPLSQSQEPDERGKRLLDSLLGEDMEKAGKGAALFREKDTYLPTQFDEDNIALCLETFLDYFPDSKLPAQVLGNKGKIHLFEKLISTIGKNVACKSAVQAAEDLLSLSAFIQAHVTDSFTNQRGESVLIGELQFPHQFRDHEGKLPLPALWDEWIQTNGITSQRLVRALVLRFAYSQKTKFAEDCADSIRALYGTGFECGRPIPNQRLVKIILISFCNYLPEQDRIRLASALAIWFIRCVPDHLVLIDAPTPEKLPRCLEVAHLLAHEQLYCIFSWLSCNNDEQLPYTFPLAVAAAARCISAYKQIPKPERFETRTSYHYMNIDERTLRPPYRGDYPTGYPLVGINAYLYAAYRGIITEPELYRFLLHPDTLCKSVEIVSAIAANYYDAGKLITSHNPYKSLRAADVVKNFLGKTEEPTPQDIQLLRFVAHVYDTIIPAILTSELSRGDTPTDYSHAIGRITRIYGADHLADILAALGNETLDRNICSGYHNYKDRAASLSYLLSICVPANDDNADTLRTALAGKMITTKRLFETALLSPEWIPIIGAYLQIDAFESVCYYFIAHMNEEFDDKRRAMIARFTPLTEDELNHGAFDANWFRSAHQMIGEKDFLMIYDAAKYITNGAKHTRARKYADATLGKYTEEQLRATVSDKRNKDLLMAYALIPLTSDDDLCRRYLYIQQFLKESKQFGSQRAASESKAVEMALRNLATNAGYSDTMRLTLRMEAKIIDDHRALLEEQSIEDVTVRISLDNTGKAKLVCSKDDKPLRSIPSKIKKHDMLIKLTNLVKTLDAQHRRTRVMLEQSMEDSTVFTFGELCALATHPVVYPMLNKLIFISGNAVGFFTDTGLADDKGNIQPLPADSPLKIAHPYDLYQMGCWKNYQQFLYDKKITQPYRQVFRELYVKTAEESETYHSLRYAGNQIHPGKTVATLKSRRWIADIETGLQKVYYKENIIARIYALGNWFSPADIESPTLEWVCFADRQTGDECKISEIPDIIFSEVMRDVDLAVSVAHAGGVDPETSHSTMEMRATILSYILPMFGIDNVKTEGHHAIIHGKMANYSVHLGSGVVHQLGGTMIPVLPVHSQHKGKIFLPFVDDDPKTAEIISKVLLFSDDCKIKDPMILSCIRN